MPSFDDGPGIAGAVAVLQRVMRGIALYAFDAAADSVGTGAAKAAVYHVTKRKHNEESLWRLITKLGPYQALPASARGHAEQQAGAVDIAATGNADGDVDTLSALAAGNRLGIKSTAVYVVTMWRPRTAQWQSTRAAFELCRTHGVH